MRTTVFLIIFMINTIVTYAGEADLKSENEFWKNDYFVQSNVDVRDSTVIVIIDNEEQEYHLADLPDAFIEWSVKRRKKTLSDIRSGIMPSFAGPHNGIVATCGAKRNDTQYKINNAVKGMGYCPGEDSIDSLLTLLKETYDYSMEEKLSVLEELYDNIDEFFAKDKLVSLELYSGKGFETGTFINQMLNPKVAIVFLDIPSYELKAVAAMYHPENPALTEYQSKLIEYTNLIHSYFHGDFNREFITVVYHITEVFDNSPAKEARGRRLIPQFP
ncbi:MAG: hypothetical protein R6U31_04495 [bacterium]